jgi:predicted transcriptional regulator
VAGHPLAQSSIGERVHEEISRKPETGEKVPIMIRQTARLVAAYLRKNQLADRDIPGLIIATHQALAEATVPSAPAGPPHRPAVAINKSVTADALICLDCGQSHKLLKRHLHTAHGLTVDEYRSKWALPADYPVVAPAYTNTRSQLAIKTGLGRQKPASVPHAAAPEETKVKPRHHYPSSRWSRPLE